jgi:hypothetical protein
VGGGPKSLNMRLRNILLVPNFVQAAKWPKNCRIAVVNSPLSKKECFDEIWSNIMFLLTNSSDFFTNLFHEVF